MSFKATLLAIDEETAVIAHYMQGQGPSMKNEGTVISHPNHWTLDFAIEVNHVVNVILWAVKNQGA